MQMQKSFSDMKREAQAARETARKATPEGYYTGRRSWGGPMYFVTSSGKPILMQEDKGPVLNTTSTPAARLSPPPAAPPRPLAVNPYNSPNPYRNTNQGFWSDLQGSYIGSGLGDFLTDLTQALTAGAQTYGQVTAAETSQALARVGVQPVGYSVNGTPIYQSTPPGVTPQYAGMVPSGLVLPAGVTPSYPYPVGFVQQGGASGVYQVQPPSNILGNTGMLLPLLAIGGGVLVLLAVMK